MITYTYKTGPLHPGVYVFLDGKLVGIIQAVRSEGGVWPVGYRYEPIGTSGAGGEVFPSLDDVKRSLEAEA